MNARFERNSISDELLLAVFDMPVTFHRCLVPVAGGVTAAEDAETLLAAMRAHPLGGAAAMIGTVHEDAHHFVQMTTGFGGRRIVDWLSGEQLPRIC